MTVSIRDQNVVKKRAIYTAVGINIDGERDGLPRKDGRRPAATTEGRGQDELKLWPRVTKSGNIRRWVSLDTPALSAIPSPPEPLDARLWAPSTERRSLESHRSRRSRGS